MSADLIWMLTKRHNAFLISKRDNCNKRSGLVLTSEPCNITSVHSFKYSGLANETAFGIDAVRETADAADASEDPSSKPVSVCFTRKAKSQVKPCKGVSKQSWKKGARALAKSAQAQVGKARPDLAKAAMAKATHIAKAIRVAKRGDE